MQSVGGLWRDRVAWALSTGAAQQTATDAVPLQAIPAILDLFKTYQVVGLGEGPHGNLEGMAFRLKLSRSALPHGRQRHPRRDRDGALSGGDGSIHPRRDVPRQELRRAWEDTTNPGTNWDKPMYEEFFTAVRDVNAKLPTKSSYACCLAIRRSHGSSCATAAICAAGTCSATRTPLRRPEAGIASKNRRALVIYGDGHFQGRGFRPIRSPI